MEEKDLVVNYRNGKRYFFYRMASAAQVQQVLDIAQPDFAKVCGNYKWHLDGFTGDYRIIAIDERGQRFVESTGKTPSQCLKNWHGGRTVLASVYGVK